MQKSYLILFVLGTLILAGCTHDILVVTNQATTSAEKVQQSTIVNSAGVSKLPTYSSKEDVNATSSNSTIETNTDKNGIIDTISSEEKLKKEIEEVIGVDITPYSLRADIASMWASNNSIRIDSEILIGNIKLYSLSLNWTKCNTQDASICALFIIDTGKSDIIFTNIDTFELGDIYAFTHTGSTDDFDIQKAIIYFSQNQLPAVGFEWCGGYTDIKTYSVLTLANKEVITKTIKNNLSCTKKDACSCTETDWVQSRSIEYTKSGKEIPETPEIREIFEFIKK